MKKIFKRSITDNLRDYIKYNRIKFSIQPEKKEKWRGCKEIKNNGNKRKTHSNMVDMNPTLSVILNVNGLNTVIKRKRLLGGIKKIKTKTRLHIVYKIPTLERNTRVCSK